MAQNNNITPINRVAQDKTIDDLFHEKGLPYSKDAERAILGAILLDNNICYHASEVLKTEDFYLYAHQRIFDAMITLNSKGSEIDLITLAEELKRTDEFTRSGGATYIASLIDGVPRTETIHPYVKIVKTKRTLRRLIDAGNKIIKKALEGEEESDVIVDMAEQAIFEIGDTERRTGGAVPVAITAAQLTDTYQAKVGNPDILIGLSTGYSDLDKMTSGLVNGVSVIAARSGHGKTALAINIASNVAIRNHGTVYFAELESPREQVAHRILSSETKIDSQRMRRGEMDMYEWDKLSECLSDLTITRFVVDDTPSLTPEMLLSRTRDFKIKTGTLDLIVVDYIQLMARRMVDGRRFMGVRQAVSYVTAYLVEISRILNVPVLALAQLNRDIDSREGHRPIYSDLAECSTIENDADLIMVITREEEWNPTEDNRGTAKLIFLKHRDGAKHDLDMVFLKECVRFEQPVLY